MRTPVGMLWRNQGAGGDSPPGWAGVDKLLPVWVVGIYFISSLFVCSSFLHYHPHHHNHHQFLYQYSKSTIKNTYPTTHTSHINTHTNNHGLPK